MQAIKVNIAILTFNNRMMLCDLLDDIARQTYQISQVYVVDNASTDGTSEIIKNRYQWVRYFRLPQNIGSSGGYHNAFKVAISDCDLLWTLDDDVRLQPDSLENLVAGYETLAKCKTDAGAVRSVGKKVEGGKATVLDIAPWRGTLFSTRMIRLIGYPRDEYFLYGEDLEYSLRMHKYGYFCYWIPSSECREVRRANKSSLKIFGRFYAIYATPFRHYYGTRNEIRIFLEYGEWRRLIRTLFYCGKVILAVTLFSKKKPEILWAVGCGAVDGFFNRLGKNPDYIP